MVEIRSSRGSRRATRAGARGTDPQPQKIERQTDAAASASTPRSSPIKAAEDTGDAWGDRDDANDQRLKNEKPPHW